MEPGHKDCSEAPSQDLALEYTSAEKEDFDPFCYSDLTPFYDQNMLQDSLYKLIWIHSELVHFFSLGKLSLQLT